MIETIDIQCEMSRHLSQPNVSHDRHEEVNSAPVNDHEQVGHICVQIGDGHTAPRPIHKVVHVARLSNHRVQALLSLIG